MDWYRSQRGCANRGRLRLRRAGTTGRGADLEGAVRRRGGFSSVLSRPSHRI